VGFVWFFFFGGGGGGGGGGAGSKMGEPFGDMLHSFSQLAQCVIIQFLEVSKE